jgi:hypothetical protein
MLFPRVEFGTLTSQACILLLYYQGRLLFHEAGDGGEIVAGEKIREKSFCNKKTTRRQSTVGLYFNYRNVVGLVALGARASF